MRTGPRRLAAPLLLALAVPAALPAQAVGIGFGFGIGTRTGFTVSLGLQVTDAVQLVCKGGGLPMIPSSVTCGTHLYVLDNPDQFVVLEAGRLFIPDHHGPPAETSWLFVQGGLGMKDHEMPDENDDGIPEYAEWANASWSGGVTLVFARVQREMVTNQDGREMPGERTIRPALWPLFFLDGQAEFYFPGRDCARC